ncbi:hypothetical protein Barb4_01073 [Bacteroidales bacterium Barb4]|nr:hypothetical protein Barb4_01073 [Bacteroidales bacterium Barb4]
MCLGVYCVCFCTISSYRLHGERMHDPVLQALCPAYATGAVTADPHSGLTPPC